MQHILVVPLLDSTLYTLEIELNNIRHNSHVHSSCPFSHDLPRTMSSSGPASRDNIGPKLDQVNPLSRRVHM